MATDFKALWRAKADGKEIECLGRVEAIGVPNRWGQITTVAVMAQFFEGDDSAYAFRVKPETITVNDHEVPAPLKSGGYTGRFFVASIVNEDDPNEFARGALDMRTERQIFDRGLAFATREGAIAMSKALLAWPKNTK